VGALECLRLAEEYDIYKIIGDIDMYTEFEMLEVKVPLDFFGTQGFSARRDGRYFSNLGNIIIFSAILRQLSFPELLFK
jgi:hypothetical protein